MYTGQNLSASDSPDMRTSATDQRRPQRVPAGDEGAPPADQAIHKDYRTAPAKSPKNRTETYRCDHARQAGVVNGVNNVPIGEEVRVEPAAGGGRTTRLCLPRARPPWGFDRFLASHYAARACRHEGT